jgi:DNA-damage-inducible protein D
MKNQVILFDGRVIRNTEYEGETYFSIIDIIEILSESPIARTYWSKLKTSIKKESQLYPFWVQLKLPSTDGKSYKTDCANTEGVLRIIQSVPSPKAEPFKLWMAELGKQAIDEASNPELIGENQIEMYRAKGYSEEWIARRMQSKRTRKLLTDEWKQRGIEDSRDYEKLTATIAKGTFGLHPSEHAQLKGLEKQPLRDHMTEFELIFSALSEETTRQIAIRDDTQGYLDNHGAAEKGGTFAGNARRNFEKETGFKVVSEQNFLKNGEEETSKKLSE